MPVMECQLFPVICTFCVHLTCYYTWRTRQRPSALLQTAFLKTNPGHSFENILEAVPKHQWGHLCRTHFSTGFTLKEHILVPSTSQSLISCSKTITHVDYEEKHSVLTETFIHRRSTQNLIVAHSQVQYRKMTTACQLQEKVAQSSQCHLGGQPGI